MNYYNEYDKGAAAWLRELIKEKLIPDGEVDERSICDVKASDVRGFTQCHFFCGIAGWSHALRLSGWPEDRPVWTGSCPCQSFSVAGKRKGKDDARHLWPVFFNLIRECKPPVVFGEQVSAAIRFGWIDDLQRDMEGAGYSCGYAVLGAHSVGAPHIRQRLYWVGHSGCWKLERRTIGGRANEEARKNEGNWDACQQPACRSSTNVRLAQSESWRRQQQLHEEAEQAECLQSVSGHGAGAVRMAVTEHSQRRENDGREQDGRDGKVLGWKKTHSLFGTCGEVCGVANSASDRATGHTGKESGTREPCRIEYFCGCKDVRLADCEQSGREGRIHGRQDQERSDLDRHSGRGGPAFWDASSPHLCRDGKYRIVPLEPALFPLADGIPGRVGLLRGAGNAICPWTAKAFIEAFQDAQKDAATKLQETVMCNV